MLIFMASLSQVFRPHPAFSGSSGHHGQAPAIELPERSEDRAEYHEQGHQIGMLTAASMNRSRPPRLWHQNNATENERDLPASTTPWHSSQ